MPVFARRRVFPRLNLETVESRLAPSLSPTGPYLPEEARLAATSGVAVFERLTALPKLTDPAGVPLDLIGTPAALTVDEPALRRKLAELPTEAEALTGKSATMAVPKPDGTFGLFRVWRVEMMERGLAEQFSNIVTWRGQGIDDPTAKLAADVTGLGFHAQVLSPLGGYYVEPYHHLDSRSYVSYSKPQLRRGDDFVESEDPEHADEAKGDAGGRKGADQSGPEVNRPNNNGNLRVFRAAVAATGEYTAFFGGTVDKAQAAIVTSMNRVSGVYETELSVRMVLVANNKSIVYTDSATDPYTNNNGSTMLGQNQTNVDAVIGTANYDIGHVFSTGGGGVAGLGVVGIAGQKARGVTGSGSPVGDAFDIDYVAHEMGHQYGGNHTFNGVNGSAAGNRASSAAYEPGSGSTIQAYAGICGADDLQTNSDAYFHAKSLDEMSNHVQVTIPSVGTTTASGNAIPVITPGPDYTIPAQTAFELTGSATDANNDALTYCWEEYDLGPAVALGTADNGFSPLFRSYTGTASPTRSFPRLANVLAGTWSPSEVMPATNRTMTFRLTVRDNRVTGEFARDDVAVNVTNTGAAFAVTSPNTAVSWTGGGAQTVTWNVAGTAAAPISAATVNILLSTDGGTTYPTVLAAGVANDGTESVVIPNLPTTQARIRVQPVGNIFFDVSNANFTIVNGGAMQVAGFTPASGGTVTGPSFNLDVAFTQNINSATLGVADLSLSTGSVAGVSLLNATTARYTIAGLTQEGPLTVTVLGGSVADTVGNTNGAAVASYTVDLGTGPLPAFTAAAPAGSLAYTAVAAGTPLVNAAGDTDAFTVVLDAGQSLAAVVTPAAALRPSVTLTGPGGTNVTATAAAAGQAAALPATPVAVAGTYTLTVSGASSTTGAYGLRALLNNEVEGEGNGGAANDTAATAQTLAGPVALPGGVTQRAVRGKFDTPTGALPAEIEPNDTTATANNATANLTTAAAGRFHLALSGAMDTATDEDYFAIGAMQAGDVLTISQSGSPTGRGTLADPFVYLYNSAGTVVASNDDNGPGVDSLVYQFSVTVADTYFVRASHFSTETGTYQLGVYLTNTGTAPTTGGAVVSETEANNTLATANNASTSWRAVQYAGTVTGTASTATDLDVSRYTFNAGDLVSAVVRSTSTLNAEIRILNSAGTAVAVEDGSSTTASSADILNSFVYGYRVPTAGTYYVEVSTAAGSATTGTYALDVFLSATTPPPQPALGFDVYAVTLAAGDVVSAGVDAVTGSASSLEVLDAGGSVVATGVATATNYDRSVNAYTAPAAGTYYVRTTGTADAEYNLVVFRGAAVDAEPNDSFAAAQPLAANVPVAAALTAANDDWFTIDLTGGQSVRLETSTLGDGPGEFPNALDPRIEVYTPGNTLSGSDDNSAGDGRNARLIYTAATSGSYRVRVAGVGGTAGEYLLRQTVGLIPAVTGPVVVNAAAAQRSRVLSLTVNFNTAVTAAPGAFVLKRVGLAGGASGDNLTLTSAAGGLVAVSGGPASSFTLSFNTGAGVDFGSLADGLWELTVDRTKISNAIGTMAADFVSPTTGAGRIYRLFGDLNGDGAVDGLDKVPFDASLNLTTGDPGFLNAADRNGDGAVDGLDKPGFDLNLNVTIDP